MIRTSITVHPRHDSDLRPEPEARVQDLLEGETIAVNIALGDALDVTIFLSPEQVSEYGSQWASYFSYLAHKLREKAREAAARN